MSCRKTADRIAAAYAESGVAVRFLLDQVDADALLAGTSPTSTDVLDWCAVLGSFTVAERSAGAIADSDLKIRFAHPPQATTPPAIYAAILRPESAPALRVAVALDGAIGAPVGGGFAGATVYRFGSVLGRSVVRVPVAHVWHLGTVGA